MSAQDTMNPSFPSCFLLGFALGQSTVAFLPASLGDKRFRIVGRFVDPEIILDNWGVEMAPAIVE